MSADPIRADDAAAGPKLHEGEEKPRLHEGEEKPRLHEGEEKPPRGVRAMAVVRWAILAVALAAAVVTNARWFADAGRDAAHTAPRYYCPMHPQITSDVPGSCPICHMKLEPIPEGRAPGAAASAHDDATMPPGTSVVTLGLDRVQAIGVRTSAVEKRRIDEPLRVTATIEAQEQGQASVHARASGFVERANVEQTGVRVRKGQELVAIYSPEIFQAEQELLATRAWGDADAATAPSSAARTKLELLGVTKGTIDRVLASGKPERAVSIPSPVSGFVAKRGVALGSYVTPETELFAIVDLSRVYVVADVFQRDAARVAVGLRGTFSPAAAPMPHDGGSGAHEVSGAIDLVYPTLGAEARTTRVRMTVPNRDLALRPGDYGTLELASSPRDALVVPRDAVVETGAATYVFVAEGTEGETRFVPRTVTLGAELDGALEIRDGLAAGEKVVSGATFLIDSESRLGASLAGSSAPPAHQH